MIDYLPIEIPVAPIGFGSKEAGGARLIIKSLVLENFKSYAGRHEVGPFHKKFSTVVGPNGSGKSNIIDALLFVFGYRAQRMRHKKISKLIHSSESCQDLDEASVTVRFIKIIDTGPGSEDYETVSGTAFEIRRTVFADGSSAYHVDNKKATHRDICDLLRSYGIDIDHNRFLILQGEVKQIAMMKPKAANENDDGMLEFLEDIIGTSRFKPILESLDNRIKELNHFRQEKYLRVKLIQQEKDALAGAKDEAMAWIEKTNEIVLLRNKFLQKHIHEAEEMKTKYVTAVESYMAKLKEHQTQLKTVSGEKKNCEKLLSEFNKKMDDLRKTLDLRKKEFANCESKDAKLQQDLMHAKKKILKLEKQIGNEEKALEELKKTAASTTGDDAEENMKLQVESIQKKIKDLESKKVKYEEEYQEAIEALRPETESLRAERKKKEKEIVKVAKTADEAKSKLQLAESELEALTSAETRENEKLEQLKTRFDNDSERKEDLSREAQVTSTRGKELKKKFEGLKKEMSESDAKAETLTQAIAQDRRKVSETKESQHAAGARNRVLAFLLEQKKAGKIPGVVGRLGDLGWIDPKYDVAVSTAVGFLDHIVVDTDATASQCIEALRKNNVGHGSFLAINKIAPKWTDPSKRKRETPAPRLYDLIKVKDQTLTPIFYFAVRDTLVATDINVASKVAYGKERFRVVTLQGELIEISGTMSGGGNRQSKGRMALSEGATMATGKRNSIDGGDIDITQVEQTILKNQHDLEVINKKRIEGVEQMHRMETEINQCKVKFDKAQGDLASLEKQLPLLKNQLDEQTKVAKNAAPDAKKVAELEKVVKQCRADAEKAQDAVHVVQEGVHQIDIRLEEASNARVKPLRVKIEKCESETARLKDEIIEVKSAAKRAEKSLQRTTDRLNDLREQLEAAKSNRSDVEEQAKQLEQEAKDAIDAHDELKGELKRTEAKTKEIADSFKQNGVDETNVLKEISACKVQVDETNERLERTKAELKRYKRDLAGLALQSPDGEDEDEATEGQMDVDKPQLPTFSVEELEVIDIEGLSVDIARLEEELGEKQPRLDAIMEYRKKVDFFQ